MISGYDMWLVSNDEEQARDRENEDFERWLGNASNEEFNRLTALYEASDALMTGQSFEDWAFNRNEWREWNDKRYAQD